MLEFLAKREDIFYAVPFWQCSKTMMQKISYMIWPCQAFGVCWMNNLTNKCCSKIAPSVDLIQMQTYEIWRALVESVKQITFMGQEEGVWKVGAGVWSMEQDWQFMLGEQILVMKNQPYCQIITFGGINNYLNQQSIIFQRKENLLFLNKLINSNIRGKNQLLNNYLLKSVKWSAQWKMPHNLDIPQHCIDYFNFNANDS